MITHMSYMCNCLANRRAMDYNDDTTYSYYLIGNITKGTGVDRQIQLHLFSPFSSLETDSDLNPSCNLPWNKLAQEIGHVLSLNGRNDKLG